MSQYQRLQRPIKIGEIYINGEGIEVEVVNMVENTQCRIGKEEYLVTSKVKYNHGSYGNGYFVNKYGQFGVTPNPRCLIKMI